MVDLAKRNTLKMILGGLVYASGIEDILAKTTKKPITNQVNIETKINDLVQKKRQHGKIAADERTSWYVYDLTADKILVNLNGEQAFQAASMIKPLIALAYFNEVKKGIIKETKEEKRLVKYHLRKMIRNSNNESTNWFIKKIGGPAKVNDILNWDYKRLFKNTEIVEYIPRQGKTYKNRVSARDYSRFLYALIQENSALPGADEIQEAMGLKRKGRIYCNIKDEIYHKTGTTARLCGDMGVVFAKSKTGKDYPYIFVGIIEKEKSAENYKPWARARSGIIKEVSGIVRDHMKHKYNLV